MAAKRSIHTLGNLDFYSKSIIAVNTPSGATSYKACFAGRSDNFLQVTFYFTIVIEWVYVVVTLPLCWWLHPSIELNNGLEYLLDIDWIYIKLG